MNTRKMWLGGRSDHLYVVDAKQFLHEHDPFAGDFDWGRQRYEVGFLEGGMDANLAGAVRIEALQRCLLRVSDGIG